MLVLLVLPAAARATTHAVVGADGVRGPEGQLTRGVLAGGVTRLGGTEVLLAGLRYDDTVIGTGTGVIVGLGLPLAPRLTAQAQGGRFFADHGGAGWRVRIGPRLDLPGGGDLLLAAARAVDPSGTRTDAALLESSIPLHPVLSVRLQGALATAAGEPAAAASGGLAWAALPHLLLIGEVGRARGIATTTGPPSPPRVLGLLDGEAGETRTATTWSTTYQLGVRVPFPAPLRE